MILTGKAKEEFRRHMKLQGLSLGLQEKFLNTEIIYWFDSVRIYILIDFIVDAFDYQIKDYSILESEHRSLYQCEFDSRQEATEAAITKANEIYNKQTMDYERKYSSILH